MENTNRIAAKTSLMTSDESVVMRRSSRAFRTVAMLSNEMAQAVGTPCRGERTTSEWIPRMVRVSGATVTLVKRLTASVRVRIRAGRRPAGGGKFTHQISPCRIVATVYSQSLKSSLPRTSAARVSQVTTSLSCSDKRFRLRVVPRVVVLVRGFLLGLVVPFVFDFMRNEAYVAASSVSSSDTANRGSG